MTPRRAFYRYIAEAHATMAASAYILKIDMVSGETDDTELRAAQEKFEGYVPKLYGSTHGYFVARTFISLVAAFEFFLTELTTCVLLRHPMKIGGSTLKLADVLSVSKEELVARAADEYLNKLMYKKPAEYASEFANILSINAATFGEELKVLVEAKARRDLGVHNAWICNPIYLRKLAEAGVTSTVALGEKALPDDLGGDYFLGVIHAFHDLAGRLFSAVQEVHTGWPADEEAQEWRTLALKQFALGQGGEVTPDTP